MKNIIQLVIGAIVLHACFQAGRSAARYYDLWDALYQETQFGGDSTASELHRRVLAIAEERGIYLEWDDVTVRKQGEMTAITFEYKEKIPLVPGVYEHPWTYAPSVTARRLRPITMDDLK